MEKIRYITDNILEDLNEKMVFVGGARQVGKTTLALKIITKQLTNYSYYNWDYPPDRKKLMNLELPGDNALIIFDEIHKYRKWKTLIKGIYDSYKEKYKIIVTGSARLNIYKKEAILFKAGIITIHFILFLLPSYAILKMILTRQMN